MATAALISIALYAARLSPHQRLARLRPRADPGRRRGQPDRPRDRGVRGRLRGRLLEDLPLLGVQRRRLGHHGRRRRHDARRDWSRRGWKIATSSPSMPRAWGPGSTSSLPALSAALAVAVAAPDPRRPRHGRRRGGPAEPGAARRPVGRRAEVPPPAPATPEAQELPSRSSTRTTTSSSWTSRPAWSSTRPPATATGRSSTRCSSTPTT